VPIGNIIGWGNNPVGQLFSGMPTSSPIGLQKYDIKQYRLLDKVKKYTTFFLPCTRCIYRKSPTCASEF
jgi:hypothetical protein